MAAESAHRARHFKEKDWECTQVAEVDVEKDVDRAIRTVGPFVHLRNHLGQCAMYTHFYVANLAIITDFRPQCSLRFSCVLYAVPPVVTEFRCHHSLLFPLLQLRYPAACFPSPNTFSSNWLNRSLYWPHTPCPVFSQH